MYPIYVKGIHELILGKATTSGLPVLIEMQVPIGRCFKVNAYIASCQVHIPPGLYTSALQKKKNSSPHIRIQENDSSVIRN